MNYLSVIIFLVYIALPLLMIILLCIPIKINEEIKKKINIARVMSVIIPGLGHVYIGKWIRGIALILIWALLFIVSVKNILIGQYPDGIFLNVVMPPLVIWIATLIGLSGIRKEKNNQPQSL